MGGGFDRILVHFQPALYYRPRAPLSKVATSAGLWWLVQRRAQTEIIVHEADPPVRWRPDYVVLRWAFRRARLLLHTGPERRQLERAHRLRGRGERAAWSAGARARAQPLGTPSAVADVGGLAEQAGPRDVVFGSDRELAELFASRIEARA